MNDVLCFRLFQALGLADGSCSSLLASRVRESGRHSFSYNFCTAFAREGLKDNNGIREELSYTKSQRVQKPSYPGIRAKNP